MGVGCVWLVQTFVLQLYCWISVTLCNRHCLFCVCVCVCMSALLFICKQKIMSTTPTSNGKLFNDKWLAYICVCVYVHACVQFHISSWELWKRYLPVLFPHDALSTLMFLCTVKHKSSSPFAPCPFFLFCGDVLCLSSALSRSLSLSFSLSFYHWK